MSSEAKTNNEDIGFAPSGSGYPYPPTNPPPYGPPVGPPQYSTTVIQQGPTVVHHGHTGPTMVQPGSVTMVAGTTAVVMTNGLGQQPIVVTCPSCNQNIVTRVEMKPTLNTHLFALLLCVFGCWPCVLVPYCVGSCHSAEHYCRHCHVYVGSSNLN